MSDEDGETTLDTRALDKLIKMMGNDAPIARVGILGGKAVRTASGAPIKSGELNNAEIGAFHEYGKGSNPERSFLRVPITDYLDKELEKSGAFDEDVLKDAMSQASFVPYMKKVATIAESIVIKAFDTGGYGKWPESNFDGKKNAQTLVETGQLRNSITSEVKASGGSGE